MAQVKIHGITKEYPEGTTWMEVAGEHQKEYEYDILLVRVNGKLQELHKQVKDCELSFVTAKDKPGMSAYQRSASLMMLKAFYSVAGAGNVEKLMIDFSIGRGFFVEARRSCSTTGALPGSTFTALTALRITITAIWCRIQATSSILT